MPYFGMPYFGMPFGGMPFPGAPPLGMFPPGAAPYAAGDPAMPNCSAGFEAMRQFFMSRAEFWSHMMRAMADLAIYAAGVAAEARKASAMMGPGGSNFFAPPGGPYGRPPDGELDLDKLKQSLGDLKGLDQAQAAKILYAVQLVQSMEAWRKSSPPGGQAASQTGW